MKPPFTIRDLGEVAIRCGEIGPMFAFYRDIIGLEVLRAPESGIGFFRICTGYAGHTCVLALFAAEAGAAAFAGTTGAVTAGSHSSLHHLALTVDYGEQDEAVAWYRRHGLEPVVQEFPWIGWRGVFVQDPEGNTVELVAKDPAWRGG
ncbi:VOC family protein [Algicella marina]|uniref:VOC family protein n=1 Tax=Algicella marina TaxID=2683284 RepID=A0A6P1T7H6_9RHOB|nr:VOC family protein [Algicella marina]